MPRSSAGGAPPTPKESRHRVRSRFATARTERAGRTLAQTFCLVFGITLFVVGVLGFLFGGTNLDTGTAVQGGELVIFEVNGWHNLRGRGA